MVSFAPPNELMKKIIAGLLILFPIAAFSQTISGTIKDDQGNHWQEPQWH